MHDLQVNKLHYEFLRYEHANRFASYYYQIKTILELNINKIIEVGEGNGFTSRELKRIKFDIQTADFDVSLSPDVVCDVRRLPFKSNSCECACAFQLLEHIPYEEVHFALFELKRISTRYIFISLPDASKYIKIAVNLPKIGKMGKLLALNRFFKKPHKFDGQHFWEINKKGFSESKIRKKIICSDWELEKETRLFENPYHRFYLLKKINS